MHGIIIELDIVPWMAILLYKQAVFHFLDYSGSPGVYIHTLVGRFNEMHVSEDAQLSVDVAHAMPKCYSRGHLHQLPRSRGCPA